MPLVLSQSLIGMEHLFLSLERVQRKRMKVMITLGRMGNGISSFGLIIVPRKRLRSLMLLEKVSSVSWERP
jgi:hypothetical protein